MIVLESNKFFQEIIDLKSIIGGKYRKYIHITVSVFISILLLCLILSAFWNFFLNFNDDILKALPIWAPAVSVFMVSTKYWHLLINRAKFYTLFDGLQAIVDESPY